MKSSIFAKTYIAFLPASLFLVNKLKKERPYQLNKNTGKNDILEYTKTSLLDTFQQNIR